MLLNILAVGDVVGNPGLDRIRRNLRQLKRKTGADFVVVNGELERAVRDMHAILDAERLRYSRIKSILTEDEASC